MHGQGMPVLQAQADEGEEGVEEARAGLSLQHGITTAMWTQQDTALKPEPKWGPYPNASWESFWGASRTP